MMGKVMDVDVFVITLTLINLLFKCKYKAFL